jgi:hypothetical protein
MRRVLGHVRCGIFGGLGFQKLDSVFVDRVEYISGRYRGVVNGGELRKLNSVPFWLRLE